MEFEEYVEYIEKKLHEKGINIQTQDYIIKYVSMNEKLFGNIIDPKKIIDRIVDNLDYNIKSVDEKASPMSELLRVSSTAGLYKPNQKRINVNPLLKFTSLFSKKGHQFLESVIMHEMDHCATTEYLDIDEKQKDQYLDEYISNQNITNNSLLNKLKANVNNILTKCNGKLPISGIFDYRQMAKNNINLRYLNEGITAFKQDMYDKFNGYKIGHNPYKTSKMVAQFIGDTIGVENLIRMHFNNDYEGIRLAFNEKTGSDLNLLVKKLNKTFSLDMLFGQISSTISSANMKKFINQFSINEQPQNRSNAEFVPKVKVDYSAIENSRDTSISKEKQAKSNEGIIH